MARPAVWVMVAKDNEVEIAAGPFPAEQDDQIEEAAVEVIRVYPGADRVFLLIRDSVCQFDTEDFDSDLMDYLEQRASTIDGEVVGDVPEDVDR